VKSRKVARVVPCAQESKIRAEQNRTEFNRDINFSFLRIGNSGDRSGKPVRCNSNVNVIGTTNTKGILCWGSYVFYIRSVWKFARQNTIAEKLVINRDTLVLAFLAFSQNLPAVAFCKVNFRPS
jgi:hypothetical protein